MRNLTLTSGVWQFKTGRSSVRILNPTGKSFDVPYTKLLGCNWSTVESDGFAVGTAAVKRYIESNLSTLSVAKQ